MHAHTRALLLLHRIAHCCQHVCSKPSKFKVILIKTTIGPFYHLHNNHHLHTSPWLKQNLNKKSMACISIHGLIERQTDRDRQREREGGGKREIETEAEKKKHIHMHAHTHIHTHNFRANTQGKKSHWDSINHNLFPLFWGCVYNTVFYRHLVHSPSPCFLLTLTFDIQQLILWCW